MTFNFLRNRFSILYAFIFFFILFSFLLRVILFAVAFDKSDIQVLNIGLIFLKGFVFDFGVSLFFIAIYAIYLLFLPQRWNNSKFNRIISYSIMGLLIMISIFSFFAEVTFWQEFESRFNFIAVDYLIYTYEVVNNINESYPLPLLIAGVLGITLLTLLVMIRLEVFKTSFYSVSNFRSRLLQTGVIWLLLVFYASMINNTWAESSANRYQNELSKAGIYSFFEAFKNNELSYDQFYAKLDINEAFKLVRKELEEPKTLFSKERLTVKRNIVNAGNLERHNVIMLTIESFSADFMGRFGNKQNLTPFLDSIADRGILFSNMYATGTRTVRGMEALTTSLPPTPGSSIIRRPNNDNLSTIGSIFKNKGYETTFIYGGDGYFDNMNQYFGSNGYAIIDHGRKVHVGDSYASKRTIINAEDIHFENAWGISDEDLYDQVVKNADEQYRLGKPFHSFVMTTSNHRPFTYPSNKIDLPSGSGREGAVKYTDYAIGKFIKNIQNKPWFKNTIIIMVADHCASSAGKNEIDISKYHIPCIIYNLPNTKPAVIETMCSQIDLYPTLFNLMGWNYESKLYGKNVLAAAYFPRIILGTYQKLAYMKKDSLVVLSPQQKVETFLYDKAKNEQIPNKLNSGIVSEGIAQYQTAYYQFKNGGLKQ